MSTTANDNQPPIDYLRLLAPAEHGGVLLQPAAEHLRHLVMENAKLLGKCDFTIGNIHIQQARRELRSSITDCATIIATGHQPDFIHAGVWAKHVVAVRLAKALDGRAVNVVVDSDAPRKTCITIPHTTEHGTTLLNIPYAQWPVETAFESMPPCNDRACTDFGDRLRDIAAAKEHPSLLDAFLDTYATSTGTDWVDQQVTARKAVESLLSINMEDLRISRVWTGPLLAELLTRAKEFAHIYNRALTQYRAAHRVRSLDRPLPNLVCDNNYCETALWIYKPGGQRKRLYVRSEPPATTLLADDQPIVSLDTDRLHDWEYLNNKLLTITPWAIRPRALTLTLWARLLLADLFIHGIGGAKYDRITDIIIRDFFHVQPPAIACASATLHLDLPRYPHAEQEQRSTRQALRDLQFNPQRYPTIAKNNHLLDQRAMVIRQSNTLKQQRPDDRAARREIFNRIRECNKRINDLEPQHRQHLQSRLLFWKQRAADDIIARYREHFFVLNSRPDLEMLLSKLPNVQDFAG